MTVFQLLMLGASAFFAYKIYEHIQTLQDPEPNAEDRSDEGQRSADAFSTFDASSLIEKGDEALEGEDLQKALAIYSEANIKEPNSEEILFKMGYTLGLQGRDDEALEYYKEVLELDKSNTYTHQAMASIYRKNKEFASAKLHLNALVEIDDSNPITFYNYGNLYVDMEHIDEAKEMYRTALELNPDFEEAKEELANLEKE
ncbi:MAG: tetratricopeptide repeat protein [Campylobacterota bacterium]|nr:tetratricopeptide repeat protein [Campylobacterota bacterium]